MTFYNTNLLWVTFNKTLRIHNEVNDITILPSLDEKA